MTIILRKTTLQITTLHKNVIINYMLMRKNDGASSMYDFELSEATLIASHVKI